MHPRIDPANREMATALTRALPTLPIRIDIDCSFVNTPAKLAQFAFRLVEQLFKLRRRQRSLDLRAHVSVRIPLVRKLGAQVKGRSEEHTSELQSLTNLVCR